MGDERDGNADQLVAWIKARTATAKAGQQQGQGGKANGTSARL